MIAYFKKKQIVPALLSTLLLGLSLGYYLWNIFFDYLPSDYQVENIGWIAYPDLVTPESYFRKKIYIDNIGEIRNAWLKVSAPDGFSLYVNGGLIDSNDIISDAATKFYNITPFLQDGTNLIAILNGISISGSRSRLSVAGYYENWQGVKKEIRSDETWKVSFFEPNQVDSEIKWFDTSFRDDEWKSALVLKDSSLSKNSSVMDSPSVFISPLNGEFVWTDSNTDKRAFFRYPLYIQDRTEVKDVWLRILIEKGYSYNLMINGILIDALNEAIGTHGYDTTSKTLNIYNVKKYVHSGRNIIGVFVYSEKTNPRVYVDGIINGKNNIEDWFYLSRGGRCNKILFKNWMGKTFDDSTWGKTFSISNVMANDIPTQRLLVTTDLRGDYFVLFYLKKYSLIIMISLVTIITWLLASFIFSRFKKININSSLSVIGLINFFLLLILILLYIISFDTRFYAAYPFELRFLLPILFLFVIILTIAFFFKQKEIEEPLPAIITNSSTKDYILLSALLLTGFILRLYTVDFTPLGGDEVTMYNYSNGVIKDLYPYLELSPTLQIK